MGDDLDATATAPGLLMPWAFVLHGPVVEDMAEGTRTPLPAEHRCATPGRVGREDRSS